MTTRGKKNNNIRALKFQSKPRAASALNLHKGLWSLYHASDDLHLSKPLPALLKTLLKGLKAGTGLGKAAIFLYEESADLLAGTAAVGLGEAKVHALRVTVQREEVADLMKLHQKGPDAKGSSPIQNYWAQTFQAELGLKSARLLP
ncbi:MAG TPA: hypothetical protein VFR02_05140, partial [bacterium]|nr:hypothetical protein [bacterium]